MCDMKTLTRIAFVAFLAIGVVSCERGFDYLQVDGHHVRATHGLPLVLEVPADLKPLGEAHFSEAYGGPAFNISIIVYANDSTLVSVHAERHVDGSAGLDYSELPADSLADISLNADIGCFDLRDESQEDIEANGFLSFLRDAEFSFDRAFVLKRYFLTNSEGTAEVVISYGRSVASCPADDVPEELAHRISDEAEAAFGSLREN
jgi:hypothetical protein